MTDLTKITTPYGLLDDGTKEALEAHGGPYEVWGAYSGWTEKAPKWYKEDVYRVAPPAKDTINWDHVADQFICMARDRDGGVYFYGISPRPAQTIWQAQPSEQGTTRRTPVSFLGQLGASAFRSYKRGTCDWKDSLVFRPGHEPKGKQNDD